MACTTSANNDGKLQNVTAAMQYKKSDADNSSWTDCGGTEVTGLSNGTYYVRVKASGTVLASEPQTIVIHEYSASTLLGDVNGDGKVNIQDVIRLLNHVNKSDPLK